MCVRAPSGGYGRRRPGRRIRDPKTRIRRDRSGGMARHFYFRNDLHVTSRGEANDLAHVLLGVIAAIARAIGIDAPTPDGRQARVLANLEPPALIVGQMPLKYVELVPCHPIDHGTNEGGRLKMPRGVEHQAAPRVVRRIADGLRGDLTRVPTRRQELPQGDGTVEQAGRRTCRHRDPVRRDFELVGLGAQAAPPLELNARNVRGSGAGGAYGNGQCQPVGASPQLNKIAGGAVGIAIARRHAHDGGRADIERAHARGGFGGKRNDTALGGHCQREA